MYLILKYLKILTVEHPFVKSVFAFLYNTDEMSYYRLENSLRIVRFQPVAVIIVPRLSHY